MGLGGGVQPIAVGLGEAGRLAASAHLPFLLVGGEAAGLGAKIGMRTRESAAGRGPQASR